MWDGGIGGSALTNKQDIFMADTYLNHRLAE